MSAIRRLAEYFAELPGIGPRQARRIVYSLLTRDLSFAGEMSKLLLELKSEVRTCSSCFQFYQRGKGDSAACPICADRHRDASQLMVVSRDADLETMEKSGAFGGLYFVLGGSVPILEKEPQKRIREREFLAVVEKRASEGALKEIIFAMNANAEGENTADYLRRRMAPLAEKHSLKISTLGRGLSTGSELEYSDKETLRNALKNRQ